MNSLDSIPEQTRRLNPHLFGQGMAKAAKLRQNADTRGQIVGMTTGVKTALYDGMVLHETKPQIRQRSGDGMNNLERAFYQLIHAVSPMPFYLHREVSLPIANGCRYKVDFIRVHTGQTGPVVEAFEVKGFKRDDAIVKLKVAAQEYPWIRFYLVTRKNKIWDYQEVKP